MCTSKIIYTKHKVESEGVTLNKQRLKDTFHELNQYGYSHEGINRLAYSPVEQQAVEYIIQLLKEAGLNVRKDAAGNIIARRNGEDPTLPAVTFGSHIDTVYNAGGYDGTVGVIAGLEIIRSLNEQHIKTKHPLELIVFA